MSPQSRVTSSYDVRILVGKICISFFLFYCEGMLSLVVLRLCDDGIITAIYDDIITAIYDDIITAIYDDIIKAPMKIL